MKFKEYLKKEGVTQSQIREVTDFGWDRLSALSSPNYKYIPNIITVTKLAEAISKITKKEITIMDVYACFIPEKQS